MKIPKKKPKSTPKFPQFREIYCEKKTISEITIRVIQKASVQALTIND